MKLFNQMSKSGGFGFSFLPGLVVGVIVGGFAGAILPELLPQSSGKVVVATAYHRNIESAAKHAVTPLEPEPTINVIETEPTPIESGT